ncbi:AzlD domain-containing protein [Faecalibaculum rodentium]|uniref:AzlD domain-containing protein n=1 Tax=Faecalibaculum rodentium TaxID=1702221 RepID=UPI0025A28927|nr:AzlD domain-containing protein [Faecalibaculum rodentium]
MNMLVLTICLALSTAIPRILPAVFISRMHFSRGARKFLRLVSVMAALIFPGVIQSSPNATACLTTIGLSVFCGLMNWPPITAVLASAGAVWLLLVLM